MILHNATFGVPIYVFDPQICVFVHVSADTAIGSISSSIMTTNSPPYLAYGDDERTIILLLISWNKTQ